MKTLLFHGKPLDDAASQVCVLYDPKDGRVVHVHGATAIRKERALSRAELEKRAMQNASAFGHSVAGLKALHVPVSAIQQRGTLKVEGEALVVSSHASAPIKELLAAHRKGRAKVPER
jgi:hypothetical protein